MRLSVRLSYVVLRLYCFCNSLMVIALRLFGTTGQLNSVLYVIFLYINTVLYIGVVLHWWFSSAFHHYFATATKTRFQLSSCPEVVFWQSN